MSFYRKTVNCDWGSHEGARPIIMRSIEEGLETSEAPDSISYALCLQNSPYCYENLFAALLVSPCVVYAPPIAGFMNLLSHKFYIQHLPTSRLLCPKILVATFISERSYLSVFSGREKIPYRAQIIIKNSKIKFHIS
jgi:hypothetical protein